MKNVGRRSCQKNEAILLTIGTVWIATYKLQYVDCVPFTIVIMLFENAFVGAEFDVDCRVHNFVAAHETTSVRNAVF